MPQYLDFLDLPNKALRTTPGGGIAAVSGTVTVGNAPNVGQTAGPWAVSGTVTMAQLPAAAALGDLTANPTTAVVGSFLHVWNGLTWDRVKSPTKVADLITAASGTIAVTPYMWAGGSVMGQFAAANTAADGIAGGALLAGANWLYNGAAFDRIRTANAASGTTGTGLMGAGSMIYDPLVTGWFNWRGSAVGGAFVQGPAASGALFVGNPVVLGGLFASGGVSQLAMPLVTDAAGRLAIIGSPDGQLAVNPVVGGGVAVGGVSPRVFLIQADNTDSMANGNNCLLTQGHTYAFNGALWERNRTANGASGTTGTGLLGTGNLLYDGTNWFPQRAESSTNPNLRVRLYSGASAVDTSSQSADGLGTGFNALTSLGFPLAFNGASFDRVRSNIITNQFNGSNATSGITSHATQVNYNNSGVIATLNITAVSGTAPTLDVKIQIADGAGTFFDLTDSAGNTVAFKQANAVSTDTLKLAPGLIERLGAVANRQYAGQLGRSYRFVSTVAGNLMSFTYRLDVSELK